MSTRDRKVGDDLPWVDAFTPADLPYEALDTDVIRFRNGCAYVERPSVLLWEEAPKPRKRRYELLSCGSILPVQARKPPRPPYVRSEIVDRLLRPLRSKFHPDVLSDLSTLLYRAYELNGPWSPVASDVVLEMEVGDGADLSVAIKIRGYSEISVGEWRLLASLPLSQTLTARIMPDEGSILLVLQIFRPRDWSCSAFEIVNEYYPTQLINGKQYTFRHLEIECDEDDAGVEYPLTFTQSNAPSVTHTIYVTCNYPTYIYNSEHYSYVPLGTFYQAATVGLYVTPGNFSNDFTNYIAKVGGQQARLANTGATDGSSSGAQRRLLSEKRSVWKKPVLPVAETRRVVLKYLGIDGKGISDKDLAHMAIGALHRDLFKGKSPLRRTLLQADDLFKRKCDLTSSPDICSNLDDQTYTDWETASASQDYRNTLGGGPSFVYNLREAGVAAAGVLLSNLATVYTVAESSLVAGPAGVVIAFTDFALNYLMPDGVAEVAEQLRDLQEYVYTLSKDLFTWEQSQTQYDEREHARLDTTTTLLHVVQQEEDRTQEQVDLLRVNQDKLQDEIVRVAQSVNTRFDNFAEQFSSAFTGQSAQINSLVAFDNKIGNSVSQLIGVIQPIQNAIDGLNSDINNLRYDKFLYREEVRQYWRLQDNLTVTIGPTTPFMNDWGKRPMSFAAVQELNKPSKAFVMADVIVQGSYQNGGAYPSDGAYAGAGTLVAREVQISLICDITYMLNHTVTQKNVDAIFRMLGPSNSTWNCASGGLDAVWSCVCGFRVNYTDAVISNKGSDAVFPMAWTGDNNRLWNHPDLFRQTGLTSAQVLSSYASSPTQYFYNATDLIAFLETSVLCDTTSTTLNKPWVRRPGDSNHWRLRSSFSFRYNDLPLNVSRTNNSYAALCEMDPAQLARDEWTDVLRPGKVIYRILERSFRVRARMLEYLETDVYGESGQVWSEDQPRSPLPGLMHAYRTRRIEFLRLLTRADSDITRKVPIMKMSKQAVQNQVTVRINSQDATALTSQDGETVTFPFGETLEGNITISTDVMTDTSDAMQLPDNFAWVGTEEEYQDDPNFFSPGPNGNTPKIVFDPPDYRNDQGSMGKIGTPYFLEQRKLDYFFALGGTFPESHNMNLSQFIAREGIPFLPRFGMSSVMMHMKEIDPSTGLCGNGVNYRDFTTGYTQPKWHCSVRRDYSMSPLFPRTDTTQQLFYQRRFRMRAIISAPMGELVQQLTSLCPSNTTVVYLTNTGVAQITLRTSRVELVTVAYSICTADGSSCLKSQEQASLRAVQPLVVSFTVSNVQYYLQVWPIDSLTGPGCYTDNGQKGISLLQTTSVADTLDVIPPIKNLIVSVRDDSMRTTIDLISKMYAVWQAEKNLLNQAGTSDLGDLQDAVANAQSALANAIANVTASDDDSGLDQFINTTATTIAANDAIIANLSAQNQQASAFANALWQLIVNESLASNASLQDVIAAGQALGSTLLNGMNYIKSALAQNDLTLGDALKDIIDDIENAAEEAAKSAENAAQKLLNNLINGLGDLFKSLMDGPFGALIQIALVIAVCVVVCCVLPGLLIKWLKKRRDAQQDEDQNKAQKTHPEAHEQLLQIRMDKPVAPILEEPQQDVEMGQLQRAQIKEQRRKKPKKKPEKEDISSPEASDEDDHKSNSSAEESVEEEEEETGASHPLVTHPGHSHTHLPQ